MTIISPSLLSCDFLNIESELKYFDNVKDFWFHLDIMDGHFVPNMTFGQAIIKKITEKTLQPCDAHFMVSNPEFYIDDLKDFRLHNFTFHFEAVKNSIEALRLIEKAKNYFPSVGISIKPKTPFSVLNNQILEKIDLLLIMSVEPGFGGQSFIENTYHKLNEVKIAKDNNQFNFQVQIDGGVSKNNAKKLIEHGSDNLVAGSYVFKDGPSSYLNKIESIRN